MSVHAVSHPTPQVHQSAPPSNSTKNTNTNNNHQTQSTSKTEDAGSHHKVNIKA